MMRISKKELEKHIEYMERIKKFNSKPIMRKLKIKGILKKIGDLEKYSKTYRNMHVFLYVFVLILYAPLCTFQRPYLGTYVYMQPSSESSTPIGLQTTDFLTDKF